LAAFANKILILAPCFDIKSLHRNRKSLLMGFSGGFKQGKPAKAPLELEQVFTSKIKVGQAGIAQEFNRKIYYRIRQDDEQFGFAESNFLYDYRVVDTVAGDFPRRGFE